MMIITASSMKMELHRCLLKKILAPNCYSMLINKFSVATCQHNQSNAQSSSQSTQSHQQNEEKTTHFGFKNVKESEKDKAVYDVFEKVANSYDKMNDAMSFGIHRIWKDMFIQELAPTHGSKLIDVAGGTGDITFRYLNYLNNLRNPKKIRSHVSINDINQNMLDVGKTRAETVGFTVENGYDIAWVVNDAVKLSCTNESFTAYTIAFGLRNITRIDKALAEAYRVLEPGGRFLCLEFSHVTNDSIKWLYDRYSFQVIPVMGMLIAGQWEPYQYLVESIRKFPKQEELKGMIEDAGFRHVTYRNLTFGMVAIHSGFKI